MKNFKLLLKNSIKSLWNSRALLAQFTVLTTIGTLVVSSVALGNFSLRNSMAEIQSKSNANGFSIEAKSLNDFAAYNIINESNKLIEDLTLNDAIGTTKIYNPLNEKAKSIEFNVANNLYTSYGFFGQYSNLHTELNNNQLVETYYTDSTDSREWNGIVFSNKDNSLSINTKMMDSSKYANATTDVFSLYNEILPPSPTEVKETKYKVFFDPNIYCFNPWSISFDKNDNKKISVNDFGIARLSNFDDFNKNEIIFNHGILNKDYSYIIGTDNTYLEKNEMNQYKNAMDVINGDTKFAVQFLDSFSNNWKQVSLISNFNSQLEFDEFAEKILGGFKSNNSNYWKFLNSLRDSIIDDFMMESKYFSFDYSIDTYKSKGLSKFFSEIYQNNKNEFNNIFESSENRYFNGKN